MRDSDIKNPTAGLPGIDVFFNPLNQEVLIAYRTIQEDTGFTVNFGKLVRISVDEMKNNCIRILLDAFAMHNTDPGTEPSEFEVQPSSFKNKHRFITVSHKEDEHALIIQAMSKVHGGYVGAEGKRFKISMPETSEDLWSILLKSFSDSK